MIETLLDVQDLSIAFTQGGKTSTAVDRISFDTELRTPSPYRKGVLHTDSNATSNEQPVAVPGLGTDPATNCTIPSLPLCRKLEFKPLSIRLTEVTKPIAPAIQKRACDRFFLLGSFRF